jgi:hypothetical protein
MILIASRWHRGSLVLQPNEIVGMLSSNRQRTAYQSSRIYMWQDVLESSSVMNSFQVDEINFTSHIDSYLFLDKL